MDDHITLDKETFKALAVDTRVSILKLLSSKQHTLTEMADALGMSHSTVKEHVTVLSKASLIKVEDTKRKWKYYKLTWKGRKVVNPNEVKVMFTFGIMLVVAFVALLAGFPLQGLFIGTDNVAMSAAQASPMMERSIAADVDTYASQEMTLQEEEFKVTELPGPDDPSVLVKTLQYVGLIAALLSMFMFGWLSRRHHIIISK